MRKVVRTFLTCIIITLIAMPVAAESTVDWASFSTEEVGQIYRESLAEMLHRSRKTESSALSGEKEITFRSVPWNCTPEVLSAALADSMIAIHLREDECESWESDFEWTGKLVPVMYLDNSGFYSSNSPEELKVAGYPVKKMYTYFAYDFDKENIYKNVEQSRFYKARYDIEAVDTKAAYEILSQKLSQLYGVGEKHFKTSSWSSSSGKHTTFTEWIVWFGANNTGVYLWYNYDEYEDGRIENETISIIYGKSDSMIMLQNLKAALAYEQLKEALEDTEGL